MTPKIDIDRAATALIKRHGEDARLHATKNADAALEGGDLDSHVVWLVILRAIEELQRKAPKSGEAVH